MARYDLDLRMGIDSRLQSAELDTGALSYAVDTQNLYIDALKEDKTTVERQPVNANLSYGLRNLNGIKSLESNMSNYSLSSGNKSAATEIYSYAIGEGIYAHSPNYFAIGKFNNAPGYILESLPDGEYMFVQSRPVMKDDSSPLFIYCGSSCYIDPLTKRILFQDEHTIVIDEDSGIPSLSRLYFSFEPPEERQSCYGDIKSIQQKPIGSYSDGTSAGFYLDITCNEYTIKRQESSDLFVIGNGTSNTNRSNAFTIDYNGNAYIQNSLSCGWSIEVPEIFYGETKINLNDHTANKYLVVSPGLIVDGNFQSDNATISGDLNTVNATISGNLNAINATISESLNAAKATISGNLTVNSNAYFKGNVKINYNSETKKYETAASEEYVTNEIKTAKEVIMKEVSDIANSIITDVWYISEDPPEDVDKAKLLWIRTGSAYGNGILYYFKPSLVNNEDLTIEEVKNINNWIPISAIYS